MIVALDGTPLTMSSGGLRRYTEELARALRVEFPEDEYHLLSDQLQPVKGIDRRWWTVGVQRAMARVRCEVFHGTSFAVPYVPLRPSVLTIHDLSPWMNPDWHSGADRVRRRTPLLLKLGIATMVVTDTEAVRREVIGHFRLAPDRVVAVHLAASSEMRPVEPKIGVAPYFVFVGTVEPRKNVPALVDAWKQVRSRHQVDMVIAGRRREDGPEIRAIEGLNVVGELPDAELARLYSGAVACVYPTLYEGFGLPVLEAMQCGSPVITSRDAAVMEVSGGAALHVEAVELAGAMEGLLANTGERSRRRELSLARAAEFSWEKTARLTRVVYAEAIRRFRRG